MRGKKQENHYHKEFILGAFVGSALGAAGALLFGTQKGKRLQKGIVHKCNNLNDAAEKWMKNLSNPKIQKRVRKR